MATETEGATENAAPVVSKILDVSYEPHKEIGKGYTIPPDVTEINLTNNQLTVIEKLEACTKLQRLILRQNAIRRIEGLENLSELVELDMFMNEVRHISAASFEGKQKLEKLDLSFNRLKDLMELRELDLPALKQLYLIHNKVGTIEGIGHLTSLEFLELGDNHIRVIENLDTLTRIDSLWLGRNKIARLEGLDALSELRILSLQSNRITRIEHIAHLSKLEELYLSHNGIESMQGIEDLVNLRVLDVSSNRIGHLEGLNKLTKLEDLWANDNQLESFEELEVLKNHRELHTVYFSGNPLADDPLYETRILGIVSGLKQLDALPVDWVKDDILTRSSQATRQRAGMAGDGDAAEED